MRQKVYTIRSDRDGFDSIAKIATESKGLLFDSLELDLTYCDFFEANMVAPLYTVIARVRNEINTVTIEKASHKIRTILRKNQFLSHFGVENLTDTNETTLPFNILKLNAGERFSDYLDRYMKGRGIPQMSAALTKKFRQSLFEIFQNAALHSLSESGIFVCGQFYPRKYRLDFTIADAGVGIRENVRRYLNNMKVNSLDAIKWAIQEGHTTKTGNQPGGLGLKLIKDFITINKGKIQIVSRFGFYQFSSGQEIFEKMDHDYPGTCVNIEINTEDTSSYCLTSELTVSNIF